MRSIEPRIIDRFRQDLRQVSYKYMNSLLEWNHVTHIVEKEILPLLFELLDEQFETLIGEVSRLRAKINQVSFRNDPERDQRIIELYKLGYSRGKIANEVGMSKWGVSKALRRLGVNSVDGRMEFPKSRP